MFKQNFENSEFNFNQVEKLLAMLRSERGEATTPLLLVLHQRRVRTGPAKKPYAVRLIQSWQAGSACPRAQVMRRCLIASEVARLSARRGALRDARRLERRLVLAVCRRHCWPERTPHHE